MSAELILVTKLIIQRDFKYSKCITCSCKVYKSNNGFKCKKGHVHSTKSWEFYFQLQAISLKSFKILRKTLFGNSIKSILGFNASQVTDLDDSSLLILIKSLNDLLTGQIACITHRSNIITLFKLYNSCTLLQFLQKQHLSPQTQENDLLKFPDSKSLTISEEFLNIIENVEYVTWEDWFTSSQDVLVQLADLKLH